MSRSKKTKFSTSTSPSQTDFRAFLKNPTLEDDYIRLSQLEILPERFVKYDDFTGCDISSYLQQTGLYTMFSIDSKQGYYPFLLHLFYTNLNFEDNDDNVQLSTLVKGVDIKLTLKSLGRILNIPYHGLTLNEIEMTDEKVFSYIYLSGQGPPMTNTKLQPIP